MIHGQGRFALGARHLGQSLQSRKVARFSRLALLQRPLLAAALQ
jgi:hypothetical protein